MPGLYSSLGSQKKGEDAELTTFGGSEIQGTFLGPDYKGILLLGVFIRGSLFFVNPHVMRPGRHLGTGPDGSESASVAWPLG